MSLLPLENFTVEKQRWQVHMQRRPNALAPRLAAHDHEPRAVLTVPKHFTLERAERAYLARRDWLRRHAAWRAGRDRRAVPLRPGKTILYRGEMHFISHDPELGRRVLLNGHDYALPVIEVGGPIDHVPQRLARWLREEAAAAYQDRVAHYCAKLGVRAERISIRDTSSRWGSCSSSGALSFSWRAIMAPDLVLDYIAAHEVSHLVHLDHSPAFWRTVHDACRHWHLGYDYLRLIGVDLMRFGKKGARRA